MWPYTCTSRHAGHRSCAGSLDQPHTPAHTAHAGTHTPSSDVQADYGVRTVLAGTGEAGRSIPGIVIAALSLAIMPFLSAAQRRAGHELGSASAVADSKQTLLCTYLSAVLLVGLVVSATLGWSWADPIAALVIAAVALKEGRDAWQGKGCCAPTARTPDPAGTAGAEADSCGCAPGCTCCS